MKKISKIIFSAFVLVLAASAWVAVPVFLRSKMGGFHWGEKAEGVYYCPMHPTYISDRPGDCPICNMKLVRKEGAGGKKERRILYYRHPMGQPDISPVPKKDSMGMDYIPVYEEELTGGPTSQVPGHAAIQIPLDKQQIMGVKLGSVEKRRLAKEIRTAGRVAYDPELFAAQQEFISAVTTLAKAKGGPYHEPPERAQALINSAEIRLRLLGMSENEIAELEKETSQDHDLILPSRLQVWIYATVYEYELPFVKTGMLLKVRVPTYSDKEFAGEIRALDPVLDPATRSIRARARVEDPEGLLKPQMYVDVSIEADLGEVVAVPEEAVMMTGERAIVFVAQGEGYFEPREVKLGAKTEGFYEVKEGLSGGEQVAVSGNFLIDSESRLQAALQSMAGGGGHQHGQ